LAAKRDAAAAKRLLTQGFEWCRQSGAACYQCGSEPGQSGRRRCAEGGRQPSAASAFASTSTILLNRPPTVKKRTWLAKGYGSFGYSLANVARNRRGTYDPEGQSEVGAEGRYSSASQFQASYSASPPNSKLLSSLRWSLRLRTAIFAMKPLSADQEQQEYRLLHANRAPCPCHLAANADTTNVPYAARAAQCKTASPSNSTSEAFWSPITLFNSVCSGFTSKMRHRSRSGGALENVQG